jgi:hypothetical protein
MTRQKRKSFKKTIRTFQGDVSAPVHPLRPTALASLDVVPEQMRIAIPAAMGY